MTPKTSVSPAGNSGFVGSRSSGRPVLGDNQRAEARNGTVPRATAAAKLHVKMEHVGELGVFLAAAYAGLRTATTRAASVHVVSAVVAAPIMPSAIQWSRVTEVLTARVRRTFWAMVRHVNRTLVSPTHVFLVPAPHGMIRTFAIALQIRTNCQTRTLLHA